MEDLDGIDFKIARLNQSGTASDREFADIQVGESGDMDVITGNDNLGQSITNRLLTRQGELEWLGHTAYGSRLYELIGEPNGVLVRAKAELYIRESLLQESRVEEVTGIHFEPVGRSAERNALKVRIGIKSRSGEFTINLNLQT